MSTKLSITVGVFPPGGTPKLSTRTIVFTDIEVAFKTFTTMLSTPPLSNFIPEPETEESPPS